MASAEGLLSGQSADPFRSTLGASLDFTGRESDDGLNITFIEAGETDSSTNFFSDILLPGNDKDEDALIQLDLDAVANVWADERGADAGAGATDRDGIEFSDAEASGPDSELTAFSRQLDLESHDADDSAGKTNARPEPAALSLITLIGICLLAGKRFLNR